MSMANDLYECAQRKCRHRYRHSELVYVRDDRRGKPGRKTLPSWTGTCPKCGNASFYIVKERKSTNDQAHRLPPTAAVERKGNIEIEEKD